MSTLLLLNFDEPADTLLPSDAMGNLGPLAPDDGVTVMPAVVDAYTGRGRLFVTASTGLLASDAATGDTLANQDITIQALLSFGSAAALPFTLYQRGGTPAGTQTSARLRIEALGLANHYHVILYTESSTGGISPGIGATFYYDGFADTSRFLLLTATRRHEAAVTVYRYYVGAELVGEVETVAGVDGEPGSAGGATTGETMVGGSYDGAAWTEQFDGILDQLKVTDYEMSAEEIRATWERITVHQPNGVAALTALTPPGLGWGADPSSRIGKLVRIAGEGLGTALAKSDEVRQNFLPDRAYSDTLARWEALTGLSPGALDSLDTRRERVAAFMARDNGFSATQIKAALVELFDLAVDDIEILKFANRWTDAFTTLEVERWHHEIPAASGAGWTIAGGELALAIDAGATFRWDGTNFEPARCITSLSSGKGRMVAVVELDSYAGQVPLSTIVGLSLFNWRTNHLLVFGAYNDAGTIKLGYRYFDGTTLGAFVTVLNPAPAAPVWLRIIRDADQAEIDTIEAGGDDPTHTYLLGYSTTGPETGYTETTVANLLTDPEWAGLWALSIGATAGATGPTFDDFTLHTPYGTRPFCWYAFRDPLLAGSPDMPGANLLLRKLRPAHTHAAAITSLSLLCDDLDDGGCDRGPMGGI